MASSKKQTRTFKKLSNVEHVRLRTGMWLGQNSMSTYNQHFFEKTKEGIKIVHEEVTEIPAKMKCIDETVMNSVDEYVKNLNLSIHKSKKMTGIRVKLSKDGKRITIADNGRGIPPENAEGVFIHLMYGENFDDEVSRDQVAGQNGVGISLVRIVSSFFKVTTYNGNKTYKKIFTITTGCLSALKQKKFSKEKIEKFCHYFDEHGHIEGLQDFSDKEKKICREILKKENMEASITSNPQKKHGTVIEFELNPKYFNNLDVSFNHRLLKQYLTDIAMTNPGLIVSFEYGKNKDVFEFKKGIEDFLKETDIPYYKIYYLSPDKSLKLSSYVISGDGKHLSWVNSNYASLGGSPVEYLENRICDEVRKKAGIQALQKRLKTTATRNDVRSCFHLLNNFQMLKPRFKSQDKSYLINNLNEEIREAVDQNLEKVIRKIDLINQVKKQLERRSHLKALDDAEKKLKRTGRLSIPKLIPATSEKKDVGDRVLFIAEGDSAIAGLRPARDPRRHGLFPLRGKPLNVRGMPLPKAMKNEEMKNIIAILNLPINGKIHSPEELSYDKVSIITDADYDGYAIRSLMLSFFYEYWPELYKMNIIHYSSAPLYEVEIKNSQNKKKLFYCVDDEEYEKLIKKCRTSRAEIIRKKRNKGLGETSRDAMRYAIEHNLFQVTVTNRKKADNAQELWFSKQMAANRRDAISEFSQLALDE